MSAEARAKTGLSAVPLLYAVLCADCETVSNSPHDACSICGSRSLISLFRTLGGTVRGQSSQATTDHRKYGLELTAKVHEIPAADLNLLIELLTRLAEVGGAVECLHLNVEPGTRGEGVLTAA